jgi:hypothetical protein
LEQMTGLKRLRLTLETAERVTQRGNLSSLRSLDDSCFNYTQVFPGHGRWPHLKMLHLRGLAIDALDLLILLFKQMLCINKENYFIIIFVNCIVTIVICAIDLFY